nr:MAG TPA: hypothetical protein [Caudoviricetes sp.]
MFYFILLMILCMNYKNRYITIYIRYNRFSIF